MLDATASNTLKKGFLPLLILGILVNALGLFIPILEPDGALYAVISKYMALNNDFVNLFGDSHDWLDKPHFPFWMGAISFKILGINSFAYKLPAFLFWLVGIRYTYALAKDLYNETTAKVALLVYIMALHMVLTNFDVRAEPYLTTLGLGAIYHLYHYSLRFQVKHLLLAALLSACAVMTKGIFILLTIGGGFAVYWAYTKQWKLLFNWRWLLLGLLIALFITPELFCLYAQFDSHPEKLVFGRHGVSGIKFFLWDSQFGRFFNTGPIKGSGDKFFFVHTLLWAFLPWSVMLYVAVGRYFSPKNKLPNPAQLIVIWTSALTFLLFSFSQFQLPHYIVIIFPMLAMLVADYLVRAQKESTFKAWNLLQGFLIVLAVAVVGLLGFYFGLPMPMLALLVAILLATGCLYFFKERNYATVIVRGCGFTTILFLFLNLLFYPNLLQYQSGMKAAEWLKKQNNPYPIAMLGADSQSLEFYAATPVTRLTSLARAKQYADSNRCIFFTTPEYADTLRSKQMPVTVLASFEQYRVSMLTGTFLNAKTRNQVVTKRILIRTF